MDQISQTDATNEDEGRRLDSLSDRQRECLRGASEGMSSKEIALQLGIAPSTVDNHIQTAMGKLNVTNRRHAARLMDRFRRRNGSKKGVTQATPIIRPRLIPSLGGTENRSSPQRKLLNIVVVAVLSIVIVLALLLSIAGAVHVLHL